MPRKSVQVGLRRLVAERARNCCEYCHCQAAFSTQSLSLEHVVPIHLGGSNSLDNLALACQGCNSHKYTKQQGVDPGDGSLVPLFHPRQQTWGEHFCWSEDYTLIIGISPIGRATVEALKLNRSGLVNLRRALYALGAHPPAHE